MVDIGLGIFCALAIAAFQRATEKKPINRNII
jgi:hypothetical protein